MTATASTLAHTTPFDLSTLTCVGESRRTWTQLSEAELALLSPRAQDMRVMRAKAKCKSTVVYMVFPPDAPTQPLPLCNQCFNEYFESHEIEADMVMRLSDDEDDFTTGDNRSKKRRREQKADGNGNGNGNGNRNGNGKHAAQPICQVPRPRR